MKYPKGHCLSSENLVSRPALSLRWFCYDATGGPRCGRATKRKTQDGERQRCPWRARNIRDIILDLRNTSHSVLSPLRVLLCYDVHWRVKMLLSFQGNHEYIYEERRCKRLDNLTKQSVVNVKIFTSDMIIWRGVSGVPRATAQDVEPNRRNNISRYLKHIPRALCSPPSYRTPTLRTQCSPLRVYQNISRSQTTKLNNIPAYNSHSQRRVSSSSHRIKP